MSNAIAVGQPAPAFRLPSAQGGEVGLEDYRGKRSVIVWFTKGMSCPFCRQHMSQLARGYPRFREFGGEILEVTSTPPSRARFYAGKFRLPFPYLCDPEYRVYSAWGLAPRSHSFGWYLQSFAAAGKVAPAEPTEFGPPKPDMLQINRLLADDDLGFFILDRQAVVRYTLSGTYMESGRPRPIPSNEEIERELARLDGGRKA